MCSESVGIAKAAKFFVKREITWFAIKFFMGSKIKKERSGGEIN